MAENRIILEGRWDCRYCGKKGIRGSVYNCPECGHTRDADVEFYLTQDAQEAEDKNTEQDWECQFCGSLVKATETVCPNCAHSRMESDKKYFDAHKTEKEQQAAAEANSEPKPGMTQEVPTRQRKSILPLLIFAAIAFFVISGMMRGRKNAFPARVSELAWEFTTRTEEYVQVEEKNWSLPPDAELVGTREEVRTYNQVLKGYETRTRTVYDIVTEYEEYEVQKDLGNGNFEIVTETRPVQRRVPRTETYTEPVYERVPVYDTMYYYRIWRWRTGPPLVSRGSYPDRGRFTEPERSDTVRASGYEEAYYMTLTYTEKGREVNTVLQVPKNVYDQYVEGQEIEVQKDGYGKIYLEDAGQN